MKTGLRNLGNTCFMNAALQCLLHIPEFVAAFASLPPEINDSSCELSKAFSRLIAETLSGKSASISPAFVKKALSRQCPYIADGCQHDAHEFIIIFLQLIEEEHNRVRHADGKSIARTLSDDQLYHLDCARETEVWWNDYLQHNASLITPLFYGAMLTEMRCNYCYHTTASLSSFNTLYVPIFQQQMEITVNVISESFDTTLSLAHLSFTIHVDSEMILGNVSEQLRGCLGVDANYSFLYLCGTWDDSIHAIHYAFLTEDTQIQCLFATCLKLTLVAYLIPFSPHKRDLESACFLRCVSLSPSESQTCRVVNACLPLLFMKSEEEAEPRFANRVRMVLDRLFEDASDVLSTKTDSFTPNDTRNFFFDATDCEETDSPFHFFSEPVDNDFSDIAIDTIPQKHGPFFALCVCHVSEELELSIGANERTGQCFTPPRRNQVQLLQRRLPVGLAMLHPRPLPSLAPIRLEDCLGSASVIRRDESCRSCKQESSCLMENCITKLPSILVILLKRFSFHASGVGNVSTKITTPVLFPLEGLQLKSLTLDDANSTYDLWAVCNHTGTASFGHYFAYCCERTNDTCRWFEFNDERVREITPDDVQSPNAYILFYRRRGTLPIPSISPEDPDVRIPMPASTESQRRKKQIGWGLFSAFLITLFCIVVCS